MFSDGDKAFSSKYLQFNYNQLTNKNANHKFNLQPKAFYKEKYNLVGQKTDWTFKLHPDQTARTDHLKTDENSGFPDSSLKNP